MRFKIKPVIIAYGTVSQPKKSKLKKDNKKAPPNISRIFAGGSPKESVQFPVVQ